MNSIVLFLFWCLSISFSSTSQIIVQKTCTLQKKYPTLIPETYTAYHLTKYVTVEYVFCWYFPTFRCPQQVEKTGTTSSLRTRLVESFVTRTVSVCCPGYEEIPNRENYCTPVCGEECENGGICYKPDECICKPQFTGVTCGEDVDECSSSGICQHNCTNYFGYHQCSCDYGFYLDTDESSCNEYSIQINSFRATLKSADSLSLDWQLESDPYIEDISGLIESIDISIARMSETTSLLYLPPESRSALFFNLLPNEYYTYELNIRTIHGHYLTSVISVATPPDGIECPIYYNTHHANPCGQGSICRDTPDNLNYTCECLPGYSEPDCENINECSGDPCRNGALCVDGINDYTCICSSQRFTGENCEIQQTLCDLDELPCNGHGTCISGSVDYTCDCDAGYQGLRCDEEIDFCSSNPCQNGGTCSNGVDNAVCECTSNYNGDLCEFVINPCIGYSCNGGVCFSTQDREPVCNCSDHLTGERCSITCTDDNGDLCVCDTDTQDGACQGYCLEDRDDFYEISWNLTSRGSTVNVPCSLISSSLQGFVSRSCLTTSRWSDVNITVCTDTPDANTTDTFSNCSTAHEIAADLLTYTDLLHSSYPNSTDIDALFDILKRLSVYSNQQSCSRDLDKVIFDVLSDLLTVSFFSRLHVDNQAKFRNSLKTIEDTILQLAPTDNVTLSDANAGNILFTSDTDIGHVRVLLPITPTHHARKYEIEFASRDYSNTTVSIPSQILQDRGVTPQLDVFIIQSSQVFNSGNTTIRSEGELISQILSVNIRNKNQTFEELQVPIQITFEIKENDLETILCVFLNELGEWSTNGITLDSIIDNKVICNAYHLSMFAVVKQYEDKTTQASIVHTTVETDVNTTHQLDFSAVNSITLISSILITALIAIFLVILCVTRFYTDTKRVADKLNTVCMINTSLAHLLVSTLIVLTFIMEFIQLSEPILCFASRAMTQYSYLVVISSIMTELIIGLVYVKFACEDGQLRKVNSMLAVSLVLCWATPAIITLFTTLPLYYPISVTLIDNTLICAFLSTDETFYIIIAYFFVTLTVFMSLSLFAAVYFKRTVISMQKLKFLMKFMPRSILLLITHLLLFVTIIPADLFLPKQAKSHIFYIYQLIVIIVLMLLMCYLQRGTFKSCFKIKEESRKEDIGTKPTTMPQETNEQKILFTDNESRYEFSPFPFNYPTVMADIGSMESQVAGSNHSRTQSDSGELERNSATGLHSVHKNSQLYHVQEQFDGEGRLMFSPNNLAPSYHSEKRTTSSLPRYFIPYSRPSESAAHNPSQVDPGFYMHPNFVPVQMIDNFPFKRSMTDHTKPKPPRMYNATSCDILDTPELPLKGIPVLFVEMKPLTRRISNSLPLLNVLSIED